MIVQHLGFDPEHFVRVQDFLFAALREGAAGFRLAAAQGLPPAPVGKAYELWAIAGRGAPQPSGLFTVDALLSGNVTALKDALHHLALPALTLAFVVSAPITKIVRAALLDQLHADYVRTAKTIGVPMREIVTRDALRNAMIPILTTIGIVFGYLMAGNVLVEMIFAWPGIGSYAWMALVNKDFEAIQGFVLLIAAIYVILNLVIDLLYSVIDPRIRLG